MTHITFLIRPGSINRYLLILWLVTLSIITTISSVAHAVALPSTLEPWRDWALDKLEYRQCPLLANRNGDSETDFVCAWPSVLTIDADSKQARFAMRWQALAESWIPLPGNDEFWPQQVQINGQAATVTEHQGRPSLRLAVGIYQISGVLPWAQRPQSLPVPQQIALIRLTVDNQSIVPLQRESDALVLGRGQSQATEADAINLKVFRQLSDGLPPMLETVIELQVAGQAREESIGPVLPPGYIATYLESEDGWPARIEADGRLRVQVQPDVSQIRINARATAPLSKTSITAIDAPWPEQEIWSYQPDAALRVTSAAGPVQVDPAQAGVPDEWHGLAAFAMRDGETLTIEQRSRGLGEENPNRLNLNRQAWLDFAGGGWVLRDNIYGTMQQDWRLNTLAPLKLESAKTSIDNQTLLITEDDKKRSGVEWRYGNVAMEAGSRIEPASRTWPISGWDINFDSVNTVLHLPFGYRLIAAPGADNAQGSWTDSWSLLDLFIVALFCLFAWRMFGIRGGMLAFLYLVLTHGEQAPLWLLGSVLAIALISRNLPTGKLQTAGNFAKYVVLILLVLASLPFAASQIRMALYPQLEPQQYDYYEQVPADTDSFEPQAEVLQAAPAPAAEPATVMDDPASVDVPAPQATAPLQKSYREKRSAELDSVVVTGSRAAQSKLLESYASTTVTQAGRGIPNWRGGRSYRLTWSGPILSDQNFSLWLSPPWLTRSLRLIAVLTLALLLLRLFGGKLPPLKITKPAAALLLISLLPLASPAQAQATPDNSVLDKLRERLARAPECASDCVSIAQSDIRITEDRLEVGLNIHALTQSAVPLPTDPSALTITDLRIDDVSLEQIGQTNGVTQVLIPRGTHRVQITYMISGDQAALNFPLQPYRVITEGDGWQISGISEDRLLTETIRFGRVRAVEGQQAQLSAQEFPPYVRVHRQISFGLDWTVTTRVERIAPEEGGFTLSLPLIAGEKVQAAGLKVRNGQIEVALPDGADEASWTSTLDKSETLALTAPALAAHAEVWTLIVSPMWNARFSGMPESIGNQEASSQDWHVFRFDPVPEEKLEVAISKPKAVDGDTQAIDSVVISSNIGKRASEHTLTFNLRATQGGERIIKLPSDAQLLSAIRAGQALGLQLEDGALSLPVQPGLQQFEIRYRDSTGSGFRNQTPIIDLGLRSANVSLEMNLPQDRWVLKTSGPQIGPAVLYWGELLVVILVAFGLSMQSWTPLRRRDWLLLGIGFSTFSWLALGIVVAWLFASAWRERYRHQLSNRFAFDAAQLALVGLTIAAAIALIAAIPYGLLGQPDMHIVGNNSNAHALRWFNDQASGILPQAGAISVPIWVYRVAMLLWALWLANAVLGWLRWALRAWTKDGWWRRLHKQKPIENQA